MELSCRCTALFSFGTSPPARAVQIARNKACVVCKRTCTVQQYFSSLAPTTLCPSDLHGAIARRYQTLEASTKTYEPRPPIARLPLMALADNAVESPMTVPILRQY